MPLNEALERAEDGRVWDEFSVEGPGNLRYNDGNEEPVRAFIPPGLPPGPPAELVGLYHHPDRANQALGRLDGLITLLPDYQVLLYLYPESALSSQIEERNRRFPIYGCLKMMQNPAS